LVAGSNPARGASSFKNLRTIFRILYLLKQRQLDPPSFTPPIAFGVSLSRNAAQAFLLLARFLLATRERNEPFRSLATLMLRELSSLVNRPVRDPHDLSHSYGSCVVIDWLHHAHGRVPGRGRGVGGQS
jgi:hypothetical protein